MTHTNWPRFWGRWSHKIVRASKEKKIWRCHAPLCTAYSSVGSWLMNEVPRLDGAMIITLDLTTATGGLPCAHSHYYRCGLNTWCLAHSVNGLYSAPLQVKEVVVCAATALILVFTFSWAGLAEQARWISCYSWPCYISLLNKNYWRFPRLLHTLPKH